MKAFLKHYNGWLGFALATVLWFIAPDIYHIFDPTAGQYDAGYIQPIIYGFIVVSFASAVAWTMIKLIAPGGFKTLDAWLESSRESDFRYMLALYALFIICIVWVVTAMI